MLTIPLLSVIPKPGDDALEPEATAHLLDQLDRDRGGAEDREPQRGQVERVDVGMVEHPLVDGGRARERGDALLGDEAHRGRRLEHLERNDRRALHEAAENSRVQTERVEERQDDQVAVALTQADDVGEDRDTRGTPVRG